MWRLRAQESRLTSFLLLVPLLAVQGCSALPHSSVGQCDESLLRVRVKTEAETYRAGENPKIWLTVENRGLLECEMEVSAGLQHFAILDGQEENSAVVWSSRDCAVAAPPVWARFEPGEQRSTAPIQWNRRPSSPGTCTQGNAEVAEGEYFFRAEIAGIASENIGRLLLTQDPVRKVKVPASPSAEVAGYLEPKVLQEQRLRGVAGANHPQPGIQLQHSELMMVTGPGMSASASAVRDQNTSFLTEAHPLNHREGRIQT